MSFRMQAAQFPQGGYPEGSDRVPASDQTFPGGTPVTWDTGAQDLNEHALATVVTNVLGVSVEGVSAGVAENPSGTVNYIKAGRNQVFVAKLVNGSGVVQVPDLANIDLNYGLLKVGTGLSMWFGVDESDTTNVHVKVIDIDLERDLVYFKFLESVIQEV